MDSETLRIGVKVKLKPSGSIDRREAVPKLVGDPKDFLIVAGLAGSTKDTVQLCGLDADNFIFAGAMGSATMMGLGLALAQPEKQVLVITGDGELLMNVGSLATVAAMNPTNLSILCIDNGHYWETGGQICHTALGTDLAVIATGAGIKPVRTVSRESELSQATSMLRTEDGPSFIILKVKPGDPPKVNRSSDAVWMKLRFRQALSVV